MFLKIAEMRAVSSEDMPVAVIFTKEEIDYLRGMPEGDTFCCVPSSWSEQQGREWLSKKQADLLRVKEQRGRQPAAKADEARTPQPPPGVPPGAAAVRTDQQLAEWAASAVQDDSRPARQGQAELRATFDTTGKGS